MLWNSGVEHGGDEGVPEAVRRDALGDPGAFRESFHGPVCGVSVHTLPVHAEEDGPAGAFADAQVQRSAGAWGERDDDVLAAFAHDRQRPVSAVPFHRFNVGAERLADPSPAWTRSPPSSLRSNPSVRDSVSTLGRRTFAAG